MHPRTRGLALVALLLVLAPAPLLAATEAPEHPWCGTRPGLVKEAVARHEAEQRRRASDPRSRFEASLAGEAEAAQVGNVAVLSDSTLVLQPKELDLDGLGLQFVPQKKALKVSQVGATVGGDLGERISLGDDDTLPFALPKGFRFPFQGKKYTGFFVNSDGNLSFGSGDGRSVARSLGNFAAVPRIAPLYLDLDPGDATGEGGVYVRIANDRVVVTWLAVPEFFDGTGAPPGPNTFQVTLLKNGTILFAYGDLAATQAVAGVGPGPAGNLTLVDFSGQLPPKPLTGAIAERFSPEMEVDDVAIAKAFYRSFADVYDNLIVFLDFPFQLLDGQAFAYQHNVKNEVQGIGLAVEDDSGAYGSKGKLRSFAQMGYAFRYPNNPHLFANGVVDSGLDIVAHEAGHRWLAFPDFPDAGGDPEVLRGRQRAHWSILFNSEASHMEGARLEQRADGSFQAVAASEGYSELDLYLMGILPPSAVPSGKYFYLADVNGVNRDEEGPQVGLVIRGRRVDVSVDQIIAANGPRLPAAGTGARAAQKAFNMAFVLVTLPGQGPRPENLEVVETYRKAWETYFPQATRGQGSVSTKLVARRGGRR